MAKASAESIELFHTPPERVRIPESPTVKDADNRKGTTGLGIIFLDTSGDVVSSKISVSGGLREIVPIQEERDLIDTDKGNVTKDDQKTENHKSSTDGEDLVHDTIALVPKSRIVNQEEENTNGRELKSIQEVDAPHSAEIDTSSTNKIKSPTKKPSQIINPSSSSSINVHDGTGTTAVTPLREEAGYFDYKPIKNTVGAKSLLTSNTSVKQNDQRVTPSTESLAKAKPRSDTLDSHSPRKLSKSTSTPIDADPATKVGRSAAKPFNPDDKGTSPQMAASPKAQNTYRYEPLPQDPGSKVIRVIDLLPTHEAAAITVRMRTVDLNDNPKYEAISYCWGPPVFDMKVIIEGRGFISITPSLRGVLRQLRDTENIRTVWADAICINQKDVDERNAQVQLMRDVYRKCTRVIAWLGDATTPSDIGMATVPRVMRALQNKSSQRDPRELRYLPDSHLVKYKFPQRNSAALRCLFHIFERAWFRRVWIIQELALAPQAMLLCGEQRVEWQDFVTVTTLCWELFTNEPSVAVRSGRYFALYIIQPTKEEADQGILPHLSNLVARSSVAEATDPRDKVFALIGLAKERGGHAGVLAAPDYSLKVEDVYTNFAIENIKTYKHLDVLSLAHRPTTDDASSTNEKDIQLPSWVPNLNKIAATDPITRLDKIVAPDQEFNQKVSAFAATQYSIATPSFHNENKQLHLQGHIIDVISKTGDLMTHRSEDEDLVAFSQRVHNTYVSWETVSGARTKKRHPVSPTADPGELGDLLFDVYWQVINGGVPDGDFKSDYLIPMAPYRVVSAGQRIKSRNCFQILERVTSWIQEAQDWWRIQWGDHPASHLVVPGIVNCRRVGRTQSGRVALLPGGARPGDQVALMAGSKVPFVVRRKEEHDVYELVGEAYVHGIMFGEVWNEDRCREICLE